MSLARKYRVQFGTPRGDRLILYVTIALALHGGAATAVWTTWHDGQTTAATPIPTTPIEFVYLDTDDGSQPETDRRAQANAAAVGTRLKNLPTNAGKEVAPEPTAGASAPKPVDMATLGVSGELVPTQGATARVTASPAEEAKAVTPPSPALPPAALTAPALSDPIPTLPSDVTLPPVRVEIPTLPSDIPPPAEPEFSTGRLLPPPQMDQSPLGALLPPPMAESGGGEGAEVIAPLTTSTAESGPEPQPIPATSGLDGLPNPDQTGPDGPVQVAAQQDQIWGDYMAQVTTQIEATWARIEVDATYHPRVRFEVNRQGELMTVQLTQPSGSLDADQAALEAVQTAAPFSPFPENAADESLVINLTFNYTVTSPIPIPITPSAPSNPQ